MGIKLLKLLFKPIIITVIFALLISSVQLLTINTNRWNLSCGCHFMVVC